MVLCSPDGTFVSGPRGISRKGRLDVATFPSELMILEEAWICMTDHVDPFRSEVEARVRELPIPVLVMPKE